MILDDGGVRQDPLFHKGVSYRSRVPKEGSIPPPVRFVRSWRGGAEKEFFLPTQARSMVRMTVNFSSIHRCIVVSFCLSALLRSHACRSERTLSRSTSLMFALVNLVLCLCDFMLHQAVRPQLDLGPQVRDLFVDDFRALVL